MRTMNSVSCETKVCNACRTAYYNWKSNNAEFGDILSRIDNELLKSVDIDEDTNSNDPLGVNQHSVSIQTDSVDMDSNPVVVEETISLQMNSTRSCHTQKI
ncbi:unnamed protein product [Rotaria magnacalcarata]|uniref:Uncharacterized protein n=1 Tax=Rotaria magnacalcarata TaxID=392030 RepID=A0A815RK44_9BILA|nr:unnamed protein product [Rotaria magnacalcarata]